MPKMCLNSSSSIVVKLQQQASHPGARAFHCIRREFCGHKSSGCSGSLCSYKRVSLETPTKSHQFCLIWKTVLSSTKHILSNTVLTLSLPSTVCIILEVPLLILWLPGGSDGKASAYNARDLGSVPGSGRSSGEGNVNPLQYSCLEKSHGQRSLEGCSPWGRWGSDPTEWLHFHFHALEKEMATHSSVLAWRIPGMGEPSGLPSLGSHRVEHDWSDLATAAADPE